MQRGCLQIHFFHSFVFRRGAVQQNGELFKAGALTRWKTELISRIIPENLAIVRKAKEIVVPDPTDQDAYNWNKIHELKATLAKDGIDKMSRAIFNAFKSYYNKKNENLRLDSWASLPSSYCSSA